MALFRRKAPDAQERPAREDAAILASINVDDGAKRERLLWGYARSLLIESREPALEAALREALLGYYRRNLSPEALMLLGLDSATGPTQEGFSEVVADMSLALDTWIAYVRGSNPGTWETHPDAVDLIVNPPRSPSGVYPLFRSLEEAYFRAQRETVSIDRPAAELRLGILPDEVQAPVVVTGRHSAQESNRALTGSAALRAETATNLRPASRAEYLVFLAGHAQLHGEGVAYKQEERPLDRFFR